MPPEQMNVTEKTDVISSNGGGVSWLDYPGLRLLDGSAGPMATEFRAKGYAAAGPVFNLYRAPTSGRSKESFGADPYLAGEEAYEVFSAFRDAGTVTVGKHYIGNDQETNRQTVSVTMDSRTLHEIYLTPFARAVEGGMNAVMVATVTWSLNNSDTETQQLLTTGKTSYGMVNYYAGPIDTCLVFVNVNAGEGFDRTTMDLNSPDDEMILNIADNCANTIVVLNTVGVVNIRPRKRHGYPLGGSLRSGIGQRDRGRGLWRCESQRSSRVHLGKERERLPGPRIGRFDRQLYRGPVPRL